MKFFSVLLYLLIEQCYGTFLNFGTSSGDTTLPKADDDAIKVKTPTTIRFWDLDQKEFYVGTNGAIFSSKHTQINPNVAFQALPNYSVYTYFADSTFLGCGNCNLYYRTKISTSDIDKINTKIQKKDPTFMAENGRILVVTWFRAKAFYFSQFGTFQTILASDGTTTYAIISYDELTYHTTPRIQQRHVPKVGFKVNNDNFCSFPGSRSNDVLKLQCRSNVFVPGLFVVGLTPDADFQCSAGVLPFACSHCTGEETWMNQVCSTEYLPVCGSNGTTYANKCVFEKERCRLNGAIVPRPCSGTPSSETIKPTMTMSRNAPMTTSISAPMTTAPLFSLPLMSTAMPVVTSQRPSMRTSKATRSSKIFPSTSRMPPTKAPSFHCDFEQNDCAFTGFGFYGPWTRRRGSTPTSGTGPKFDASGSFYRYYVHFEATYALTTPLPFYSISTHVSNHYGYSAGCLRFSYHMYGLGTGTLFVTLTNQGNPTKIVWVKSGNQGGSWFQAQLDLNNLQAGVYNLTFAVIKGPNDKGDIAVDNIMLSFGYLCPYSSTTYAPSLIKASPASTTIAPSSVFTPPPPPKNESLLYPYGPQNGDRTLPSSYSGNYYSYYIPSMLLFSTNQNYIYIHTNGIVSIGGSSHSSYLPSPYTFVSLYRMNLDTRYTGKIYYRDTTDYHILRKATQDVLRLHPYSSFQAKRALIVSYIDVPSIYSSSQLHTFQGIAATDGKVTYGVFNYARLDRSSALTGYSEGYCNYKTLESTYNSRNLLITTNVGIKGRHVHKLTSEDCFKPLGGVKTVRTNINFYNSFGTYSVNVRFRSTPLYIAPVVVLLEVVTTDFANSICYSYLNGVSGTYTYISLSYIIAKEPRFNLYTQLQVLAVFGDLDNNSMFQYGLIQSNQFSNKIVCQRRDFTSGMKTKPAIKLTADLGRENYQTQRHVNVWLRDVTMYGFEVCYKEAMAFSGPKNMSIQYVAVADNVDNITEYGDVRFRRGFNFKCRTVYFKLKYVGNIFVFTTPEEVPSQDSQGVLISWINQIGSNYVKICAVHSDDDITIRERDVAVHYIVQGEVSPCTYVTCPDHLECRLDYRRNTYCGCIQSCRNTSASDVFCGTDFVTYASECEQHKYHCERYGNSSKSQVEVAHMGKCERFPYQTGVTQLENVPGVPTVFCKHINLNPNNFHSGSSMSVQLSASWGEMSTNQQNDYRNNKTRDATASWSEELTMYGFKACVMVAGRHFFGGFDVNPTVHWLAYQPGFAKANRFMDSGIINMTTWYTGSRCVNIPRNYYSGSQSFFVSVEHTLPRTYENAMTAWVEGYSYSTQRVCARELQNFDGIHSGIRLHWFSSTGIIFPFMSESNSFTIQGRYYPLGSSMPAVCKTFTYNFQYPTLPNPTVIISGHLQVGQSTYGFSNSDIAVWIEYMEKTQMKICTKSLRYTTYTPAIKLSYTVFPALCEHGYAYVKGNCYKHVDTCSTYNAAQARCQSIGAALPTVTGPVESYFIEQATGIGQTWIGLSDRYSEGRWWWDSGSTSTYRNWLPNKPDGSFNENCAVVDGGYFNKSGWDDVPCETCAEVKCQKDADLLRRSCSHFCLNGGQCVVSNSTTNQTGASGINATSQTGASGFNTTSPGYNSTRPYLSCVCPEGIAGYRCEINISALVECKNYTTHTEAWRKFDKSNTTQQVNAGYCDAVNLTNGWHKFDGAAGTRLLDYCTGASRNRCGTRSPGWVYGGHPTVEEGIVSKSLRFYTHYCADDHGTVHIRNCGRFYTYRFEYIPRWSCDYGVCTT